MKTISFNDVEAGSTLPEHKIGPIHHMDLVRYAGASGDFNPIHTDPEFANQVGLGGTIAHGMYMMAQIGRLVTNWVNPKQVAFFGVKFKGMGRPGEILVCTGTIKKKKEENGEKRLVISVQAANDKGEIKVGGDVEVVCS